MDICPAILVDNKIDFEKQITEYTKYFRTIDIDVNVPGDSFQGMDTPALNEIIEIAERKVGIKFNFHLMMNKPFWTYEFIKQKLGDRSYFFVHQEADLSFIDPKESRLNIGLCVKLETKPEKADFYSKFSEIQLMAVDIGYQGSKFDIKVLTKAKNLRLGGYNGRISIDGGINLESVIDIKASGIQIDRLSVGSYFSRSKDVKTSLEKMKNILN